MSNIEDLYHLLISQIKETPYLQWIAVIAGIAQVLWARANKVWLYPAGILSVLISAYLLFKAQLYAESTLNVYYLVMSIYGWIFWVRKRAQNPLPIAYSNFKEWIVVLAIISIGWLFLYLVLKKNTDSDVPAWDAWVSSTAWAGMWLLTRRKIENWLLLNISNLFAIPLLFYKQLPLFALFTIFLFVMGIIGFIHWKRKL